MAHIFYTQRGDYVATEREPAYVVGGINHLYQIINAYERFYTLAEKTGGYYLDGPDARYDGLYASFARSTTNLNFEGGEQGDVLITGAGNDFLRGYAGADRLRGGSGSDTFIFGDTSEFSVGTLDRIEDFSGKSGERDKIDLSKIADFKFVGARNFSGTDIPEVRVVRDHDHSVVLGDRDGNGSSDFSFWVRSEEDLVRTDFILHESGSVASLVEPRIFDQFHIFEHAAIV